MKPLLMLFEQIMTMVTCWAMALTVGPLGLTYEYCHNSRAA